MKIKDLIKELEILQVKYGQDAKVFTNDEVGSSVELTKDCVYVCIHDKQLKICLEG